MQDTLEDRGQTISESMGRGQRRNTLMEEVGYFGGVGGARNVGGQGQTISENI